MIGFIRLGQHALMNLLCLLLIVFYNNDLFGVIFMHFFCSHLITMTDSVTVSYKWQFDKNVS